MLHKASNRQRPLTLPRSAIVNISALLLVGCEGFGPPLFTVERNEAYNRDGLSIYADLKEDWTGKQWLQFTAYNNGSKTKWVRVSPRSSANSSGFAEGEVHEVLPADVREVAYSYSYLNEYRAHIKVWDVNDIGRCDTPPPE